MPKWLRVLATVGPQVLMFTPLAPIAGIVVGAIQTAESIPGATGPQKKALVQQLVTAGVQATNTLAGKMVIDPAVAQAASGSAIDTVVNVANIVEQIPGDAPPTP